MQLGSAQVKANALINTSMGAAHRILPCIASSGLLDRRRDTLAHRSGSAVVSSYRCRRSADGALGLLIGVAYCSV